MQLFEATARFQRLLMVLRLVPLLCFCTFTPALVLRVCIYTLHPDFYPHYGLAMLVPLSASTGWFVFDAIWATAVSCLGAGLVGGWFSVRLGIALASGLGLADGIIVNTANDMLVGIVFGLAFGLVLGISFNSAHAIRVGIGVDVTVAVWLGVVAGLAVGALTGIVAGYWAGFLVGTVFPAARDGTSILGSVVGILVGGTAACIVTAVLGLLVRYVFRAHRAAVTAGVGVCMAVAAAVGITLGVPVGDAGSSYLSFLDGVHIGLNELFVVGVPFLLCYLLSYYRLPLYPFSAYSLIQAYMAAKRTLHRALDCLQRSSLHWDECVYLPLPYLRSLLLLLAEQSPSEALEEIDFIVRERSQQRRAAQLAVYEMALRDLEQRTTLRSIVQAHQRLAVLMPPEIRNFHADAALVFRLLDEASQEAASSQAQTDNRRRRDALQRMLDLLNRIPRPIALHQHGLDLHLRSVIGQWSMLAEQVQETLEGLPDGFSIDNPYVPGKILEVRDPLFVGRNDIALKLGQALQRHYMPTFLLSGERRMGKSSIIRQLPILLGSRYIIVFYDLQRPGVLASAAAFFASVSAGVKREFRQRGLVAPDLERARLDEAQERSEIAVYDLVEQWVRLLEEVLEQADCKVMLAFDEFEKLDEAEERKSIDLRLLFDFFRSQSQQRSRLALLFSGARLTGDMGRSWAGYFVNVERIGVSFLRAEDARALVMNPVPQIFSAEVADEIVRLTNGQPFLIQAICNHIIEHLIEEAREQAVIQDVERVIGTIFQAWPGYFWDLWDRSDAEQRACLQAIDLLDQPTYEQIVLHTGLSPQRVQVAVEKLQMRDLALMTATIFRIAIPLFARWMQSNRGLNGSGGF